MLLVDAINFCDIVSSILFVCYVTRVYSWLPVFCILVSFSFLQSKMRYCSGDAPRTAERNVNLKTNTSEKRTLLVHIKCFIPMNELPASFSNKSNFLLLCNEVKLTMLGRLKLRLAKEAA